MYKIHPQNALLNTFILYISRTQVPHSQPCHSSSTIPRPALQAHQFPWVIRGLLHLRLISLPFAPHPRHIAPPHPPPFIVAVAIIPRDVISLYIAIPAGGQGSFVVRFVVNCKSSMMQVLILALKALVLPEFFCDHMRFFRR